MLWTLILLTLLAAPEEESLYAPTPMPVVDRMLQFAEVTEDDIVWDLGCGDARIPILASKKYKCKSYGVDIDKKVATHAASLVQRNKLEDLVTIYHGDVRGTDFSDATVVTIYLMPSLSRQLVPAFKELKPGSRVVAHGKWIPGWRAPDRTIQLRLRRPDKEYEDHSIYMWVIRQSE
jgi:SAM-dependent methyltransferase